MPNDPALEMLAAAARALAHAGGTATTLQTLLDAISEQLGIESTAIFIAGGPAPGGLEIAASTGVGEPAIGALAAAVRNPAHPVARTAAERASSFDVLPTAPGGPALRSHLPLTVTRDGREVVLGVLALAHQRPIEPRMRPALEAMADLAAVAVDRGQTG